MRVFEPKILGTGFEVLDWFAATQHEDAVMIITHRYSIRLKKKSTKQNGTINECAYADWRGVIPLAAVVHSVDRSRRGADEI